MHIETRTIDPIRVAYIRNIGPYTGAGKAWERLTAWAGPAGLLGPDTLCIGIGHDDPRTTPEAELRYDACVPAPEGIEGNGEVAIQTIAGGEYAVALHEGSYDGLAAAYGELCGNWLAGSGRTHRAEPLFEIYLNMAHDTAPEDLRTEIWLPLDPE